MYLREILRHILMSHNINFLNSVSVSEFNLYNLSQSFRVIFTARGISCYRYGKANFSVNQMSRKRENKCAFIIQFSEFFICIFVREMATLIN